MRCLNGKPNGNLQDKSSDVLPNNMSHSLEWRLHLNLNAPVNGSKVAALSLASGDGSGHRHTETGGKGSRNMGTSPGRAPGYEGPLRCGRVLSSRTARSKRRSVGSASSAQFSTRRNDEVTSRAAVMGGGKASGHFPGQRCYE